TRPRPPPQPRAREDRRKEPSPPPPSRGVNEEAEINRFGNPPTDSVRSDTALNPTERFNTLLRPVSRSTPDVLSESSRMTWRLHLQKKGMAGMASLTRWNQLIFARIQTSG